MAGRDAPAIVVLGSDGNRRGDLLARATSDVAHSLGYTATRINVAKSGREVDLQARHRVEPRLMVAECKATGRPVGGDVVNKFAGVLDAERRGAKGLTVEGYVISLAGFTATALEQEDAFDQPRLSLLDGAAVRQELVAGRLVVPEAMAVATAAAARGDRAVTLSGTVLLLHDVGWIWCVSFGSVAVLVHADGNVLERPVADAVAAAYRQTAGYPADLAFAGAPEPAPAAEAALAAYRGYLESEFGAITLEGLPTDEEISTRHLRLESLYVPMAAVRVPPMAALPMPGEQGPVSYEDVGGTAVKEPVGTLLAGSRHLAILALPGGGKSTLVKRLAVAYGDPDRRTAVDDGLPDEPWLPVVLRCRQLGDLATSSLETLLADLARRAELAPHADAFIAAVMARLRDGRVLLLVDGLDEVNALGARAAFVGQLRTIVARYPSVRLVITSREAGFRAVSGSVGALCDQYRLADLSDDDIATLTAAWHREVVGDRDEAQAEAKALAGRIVATDRVRRLARNPLLLTTLLLVKRWVGDLPRKRSVLYGKAIEVLLATWNVEGHEPLDPDEVLPQLGFVAHRMMCEGLQRIPAPLLTEWLVDARSQMPEVLGYARMSVSGLVARVEERSSLLSLSGHEEVDGRLEPTYEFKHLTFQEYLAALALARGWFDGHANGRTAVEEIARHIADPAWREVVPLAAVLFGREAVDIVQLLRDTMPNYIGDEKDVVFGNLVDCLADEVQVSPGMVKDCVEALVHVETFIPDSNLAPLLDTRFADDVVQTALAIFERADESCLEVGSHLSVLARARCRGRDVVRVIGDDLASPDVSTRVLALLAAMDVVYARVSTIDVLRDDVVEGNGVERVAWLVIDHDRHATSAEWIAWSWALVWVAYGFDLDLDIKTAVLRRLARAWTAQVPAAVLGTASWAIAALVPEPTIRLDGPRLPALDMLVDGLRNTDDGHSIEIRRAARTLLFYCGATTRDLVMSGISAAEKSEPFYRRLNAALRGEVLRISLLEGEPLRVLGR